MPRREAAWVFCQPVSAKARAISSRSAFSNEKSFIRLVILDSVGDRSLCGNSSAAGLFENCLPSEIVVKHCIRSYPSSAGSITILLKPILSVVSKSIALSITLRSSRTLPGQSCFCKFSTANFVKVVIFLIFSGQILDVFRKYLAKSGMSSLRSGDLNGAMMTGQILRR